MNSNIIEKYIRETYYYIIKVEIVGGRYSGEVYYKIGEGTSKRPEELKKKYSKLRNINVEILDKKLLPQNTTVGKRLNDKVIHRNILSKMNSVDSRIIENLLYTSDGSNEFFETTILHSDIEVVNYIDEVVNELAKDINNFTAKIKYDKNYYLHYNNKQSHVVSCANSDKMFEHANVTDMSQLLNKTVLLVGQYAPDMIASIAFICKEIIIWHDTEEQRHRYEYDKLNDNKKIVYINSIKELMDMGKHIDIILSNPPYKMGNEITRAIVDNVDFDVFINLMPCSCYKAKNLFKDVRYIETAVDGFADAIVGDSLTIAILEKDAARYDNFDELENCKRDPQFQEYYKLNTSIRSAIMEGSCVYIFGNTEEELLMNLSNLNINKDFCITTRTAVDGVHELGGKGAFDIDYNINKNIGVGDIHYYYDVSMKKYHTTTFYLHFNSSIEKQNLCRFWYTGKSGLMHKLIKGLNKTGGSIALAIPRINWSKSERDYEHATLEDIMNWLREDNNL